MGNHVSFHPDSPLPRAITLRPAAEQDEPFLYQLYKLSRVEEFAMTGISEMHFDLVIQMQYSARKAAYESNYPEACRSVVSVDGADAGQIWVSTDKTQYRVIDIALAGQFQNQGIGASLMKDLIAEASGAGAPLRCSVATNNPGSLRFHQRLGFRIVSSNEAYYEMAHHREGSAADVL
jgi:ribosomal protein S18 acetylase RimI-like enzyme